MIGVDGKVGTTGGWVDDDEVGEVKGTEVADGTVLTTREPARRSSRSASGSTLQMSIMSSGSGDLSSGARPRSVTVSSALGTDS